MAIMFQFNIPDGRKPIPGEPQVSPEAEAVSRARGHNPHPLSRAEFFALPHVDTGDLHTTNPVVDTSSLVGCQLEFNPAVFTPEEIEYMANGGMCSKDDEVQCNHDTYGYKWRVWVDGVPSHALMAATPWETKGGAE